MLCMHSLELFDEFPIGMFNVSCSMVSQWSRSEKKTKSIYNSWFSYSAHFECVYWAIEYEKLKCCINFLFENHSSQIRKSEISTFSIWKRRKQEKKKLYRVKLTAFSFSQMERKDRPQNDRGFIMGAHSVFFFFVCFRFYFSFRVFSSLLFHSHSHSHEQEFMYKELS